MLDLTRSAADEARRRFARPRLANLEPVQAEQACQQAAARHPLSVELSYLHAILLMELGRTEEAVRALRRVLYLDRSLAIAHFTLGSILGGAATPQAHRAYRNALALCSSRPPEEAIPLADGETAGRLCEVARAELVFLTASGGEA